MAKYIDKSAVVAEIEKIIEEPAPSHDSQCPWEDGYYVGLYKAESIIDTLEVKEVDFEREQEHPEPYFYCKYGGIIPLCSDCKRNHNNSPFKTEEITTWYAPSNGTKRCIDYIQQEQPEVDLEKEFYDFLDTLIGKDNGHLSEDELFRIAEYFYELGLKTKEE